MSHILQSVASNLAPDDRLIVQKNVSINLKFWEEKKFEEKNFEEKKIKKKKKILNFEKKKNEENKF